MFPADTLSYRDSSIGSGFYSDIADSLGALQIWPEHRYYGPTPYRPGDSTYERLNIEQTLVDHIELVLELQRLYKLSQGPVIAMGTSYSKCRSLTITKSMAACFTFSPSAYIQWEGSLEVT